MKKVFWKKEYNEYSGVLEEYYLHGYRVEDGFGPTVYGHAVYNGKVVRNFSIDAERISASLLSQL